MSFFDAESNPHSLHLVSASDPGLINLYDTLKGAGLHVLLIDQYQGIDSIVNDLQASTPEGGYTSFHFYGHGVPGAQALGVDGITGASLDQQRSSWERLAASAATDADILLYGCNVGAGAEGQALIDQLARITRLDVAASDDITGKADWDLEVQKGSTEHGAHHSLAGWTGTLKPKSASWMNVLSKDKERTLADAIAGERGKEVRKADFVGYHLTNQIGSDNTVVSALQDFWNRVEERTKGKLNMTVLQNDANIPGSDNEALLGLSNGRFDAVTAAAPIYSGVIPEVANIMALLFAVNDSTEGRALANSPIFGQELQKAGKAYNWHFLTKGTLNQGMRDVTTIPGHSMTSAADLDGFVLRIPPAKAVGDQLKALGVIPVEAPVSQLQTILKSGQAYGQENPPSFIQTFNLKGICDQISLTHHLWTGFLSAINLETWNSWPAEWKKIVRSEQRQMQEQQWSAQDAFNQSVIDRASTDYNMNVVTPDLSAVTTNETFVKTRNQVIKSLTPKLRPLAREVVNGYYEGN